MNVQGLAIPVVIRYDRLGDPGWRIGRTVRTGKEECLNSGVRTAMRAPCVI
jgi:hypothetical protein